MNVTLHVRAAFDAVYSINGAFFESAERISLRADEVAYITAFPLSAALFPYTVKLAGGKARCNDELARAVTLPGGDILLELAPRYGYVYSPRPRPAESDDAIGSPAKALFERVKRGDFSGARKLMTPSLADALTDERLAAFFEDYERTLSPDGLISATPDGLVGADEGCCLLVTPSGRAALFRFTVKDGLVDDVTELDSPPPET